MGADSPRRPWPPATRSSQRAGTPTGVQGLGPVERSAGREARRHQPRGCRGGGASCVDRFGRIDVLVNNAASFYAGFFEELTPEQFDRQLATSLIGPMNVTRAVLPVMRKQRSGHIISISSSAGLVAGFDFVTAYAASKFGLEGWMESLQAEVAPFGIHTTIVNPGFFRTELLTEQSTQLRRAVHRRLRRAPRRRWSSTGNRRMASSPATRRSSRARSSPLRARSRRRAASSPAPMPLPAPSRRSPT